MKSTASLRKNASIIILTGAGISAESGLPTFRAIDGLWEGHRVEDVATPEAFIRDPARVHQFYNERRAKLLSPEISPNAAHEALARLEAEWKGEVLIVTQNIDDLHERAGTNNLLHMHGEVLKAFCRFCRHKIDCRENLSAEILCGNCARPGGLRPDIVWFGEMPYFMGEIADALQNCDLFAAIGTSGNVYPAAGFAAEALRAGAVTAEINLEPSQNAFVFHETLYGRASETVPAFVEALLT